MPISSYDNLSVSFCDTYYTFAYCFGLHFRMPSTCFSLYSLRSIISVVVYYGLEGVVLLSLENFLW
jgi:hypothetical protein